MVKCSEGKSENENDVRRKRKSGEGKKGDTKKKNEGL
jgi:uncharacterized low-complexity protein